MKKAAKILEELSRHAESDRQGSIYKIVKCPRRDRLMITGPKGTGVIIRKDVLNDLGEVVGAPDIDNHPRGILFYWAVEHAPKEALQTIADSVNALTDAQAGVLYDLTVSAKNGSASDWKKGWRNALYYGLSQSPQA